MAIISIARQLGSNGMDIAHLLEEELEYSLVNKEEIKKISSEYGIDEKHFNKIYDEKRFNVFDFFSTNKEKYREVIKLLLYQIVKKNNVIIIGLGSQLHLSELPNTIRLRFIAPWNERVDRIMKMYSTSMENAEKLLNESDNARINFNSTMFEFNWNAEGFYDLILNTQRININSIIELVKTRLNQIQPAEEEKGLSLLDDYIMCQKVMINIIHKHNIEIKHYLINFRNGVVCLKGALNTETDKKNCINAVMEIKGVNDIKPELYLMR